MYSKDYYAGVKYAAKLMSEGIRPVEIGERAKEKVELDGSKNMREFAQGMVEEARTQLGRERMGERLEPIKEHVAKYIATNKPQSVNCPLSFSIEVSSTLSYVMDDEKWSSVYPNLDREQVVEDIKKLVVQTYAI